MGTAASSNLRTDPAVGLPVNPRVEYADKRSKNENKAVLIDAPVLVKLQHGTIRYRYDENGEKSKELDQRVEKPHEGPERAKKNGYFFHSRLNDFSENADKKKEDSFKFAYVYKGAKCAKQKKVYYVFGKGLHTNNAGLIEPSYNKSTGDVYGRKPLYKHHGHVYVDLVFLKQDYELSDDGSDDEHEYKHEPLDPESPPSPVELLVSEDDTYQDLQRRLAIRFFKPAPHIHVFHRGLELVE